jgi:hypothetical protein
MIPSINIDKSFNVYVSEIYGLIITNLSSTKYMWKTPGG